MGRILIIGLDQVSNYNISRSHKLYDVIEELYDLETYIFGQFEYGFLSVGNIFIGPKMHWKVVKQVINISRSHKLYDVIEELHDLETYFFGQFEYGFLSVGNIFIGHKMHRF